MNKRMAGFTIAASVLLALATQPARATDVPFIAALTAAQLLRRRGS